MKIIVGVFPIHRIDRDDTENSLRSYGFPEKVIVEIIRTLHSSGRWCNYLTFISKKPTIGITNDYPDVNDSEKYILVEFKDWNNFIAKANLIGSR